MAFAWVSNLSKHSVSTGMIDLDGFDGLFKESFDLALREDCSGSGGSKPNCLLITSTALSKASLENSVPMMGSSSESSDGYSPGGSGSSRSS